MTFFYVFEPVKLEAPHFTDGVNLLVKQGETLETSNIVFSMAPLYGRLTFVQQHYHAMGKDDLEICTLIRGNTGIYFHLIPVTTQKKLMALIAATGRGFVPSGALINPIGSIRAEDTWVFDREHFEKMEGSAARQKLSIRPLETENRVGFFPLGRGVFINFETGHYGRLEVVVHNAEALAYANKTKFVTKDNYPVYEMVSKRYGCYKALPFVYDSVPMQGVIQFEQTKQGYRANPVAKYGDVTVPIKSAVTKYWSTRPIIIPKDDAIQVIYRSKAELSLEKVVNSSGFSRMQGVQSMEKWFETLDEKYVAKLNKAGFVLELPEQMQGITQITDENYFGLKFDNDAESWWFDISAGIRVGDSIVDIMPYLQEFLQEHEGIPLIDELRAYAKNGVILLKSPGKPHIPITPEALAELLERIVGVVDFCAIKAGVASPLQIPMSIAIQNLEASILENYKDLMDYFQNYDGVPETVAVALNAEFRYKQQEGFNWLNHLAEKRLGGILADDMGLGKTLQILAHMRYMKGKSTKPHLLVVPSSVLDNWMLECQKFTPDLHIKPYYGTGRVIDTDTDVVITTYGTFFEDHKELQEIEWFGLFLDEAQTIKNVRANTTIQMYKVKREYCFCISGTPVENNLSELWSLMNISVPKLLGSWKSFRHNFLNPIEKYDDENRFEILSQTIMPFIVENRKEDVATDLPPKVQNPVYLEFDDKQREIYESLRMMMNRRLNDILEEKGLAKSGMYVIEALLKLRQTCCHTDLLKNPDYAGHSVKINYLKRTLPKMIEEGNHMLLFSQFTEMLDIIGTTLEEMNIPYLRLDGKTPRKQRQILVDKYQTGEYPVFLISVKAGGVGLNLTRANKVIHFDHWWNQAVENQATDRAYRIGQTREVEVIKLIIRDSVEEKVVELQKKKDAISQVIRGRRKFEKLSNQQMIELLDFSSRKQKKA